ncbi:MAG: amidohydrolase family protein [Chitinophagales bacterium]
MKIDVHCHYGPWPWVEAGESTGQILAGLERAGIVRCLLSHSRSLLSEASEGNRALAAACEADPRLLAYAYVDPFSSRALAELRECAANPVFVGAKTRPVFHGGLYLDAAEYRPALETLAELGWPLLVHTERSGDAAAACRVAAEWPSLPLILAHATRAVAQACSDHANIHFDFARSTAERQLIDLEGMVALVGAERILFGTDAPLIDPAWTIGLVESAALSEVARRAIYRENALRLFPTIALSLPREV